MQTLDAWLRDMPQQFQSKKNIEILVNAFAKQMDEVIQVLDDINSKTDLDVANGVNLDRVGDILCLTRKDATEIVREAEAVSLPDALYRQVLRYQKLKTSSECTYEDIMGAISLLWGTDKIEYKEDPERPATVLLELPEVSLDVTDPAAGRILSIKSAGVAVYYVVGYHDSVDFQVLEKVFFSKMEITSEFQFWRVLYFDGTWQLDGKYKLNGVTIPLGFGISYGAYKAQINEEIAVENMAIVITEQMTEKVDAPILMLVTSEKIDEFIRESMGMKIYVLNGDKEKIDAEVILKKNLWYLDGSNMLDGSKQLNASITKEVL